MTDITLQDNPTMSSDVYNYDTDDVTSDIGSDTSSDYGVDNDAIDDANNSDVTSNDDNADDNIDDGTNDVDNQADTYKSIKDQVNQQNSALNSVRKNLKEKGIDFNQAIKEYTEFGAISKQTQADLNNAGYPKELIETFIQSRKVLEEQFTQEVYKQAGGVKEYESLINWASNNIPKDTLQAFNKAIDSNNLEAITLMIDGMKARRASQQGTRNPTLLGKASNQNVRKGFADKAEMIKAMSDPRYGRDPKYMREVEQKMKYTDFNYN